VLIYQLLIRLVILIIIDRLLRSLDPPIQARASIVCTGWHAAPIGITALPSGLPAAHLVADVSASLAGGYGPR
jgi:hypothetical protein